MIVFNGYKFAETEKEVIDSLFQGGGTLSGKAKRTKRSIKFYDMQGNIFAVINQELVTGSARKLDNGKIWYSYMTPYFADNLSMSDKDKEAEKLAVGRDCKGYFFK